MSTAAGSGSVAISPLVAKRGDPSRSARGFLTVLAVVSGIGIVALLWFRRSLPNDLIVVMSTTVCGLSAARLRRVRPTVVADAAELAVRGGSIIAGGLLALVFNTARAGHPPAGWAIAGVAGFIGLFAAWLSPPVNAGAPFDAQWANDAYRRAATMLGAIGLSAVGVAILTALMPAGERSVTREFLALGAAAAGALLSSVAPHAAENVPATEQGLAGATPAEAFEKGLTHGLAGEQAGAVTSPVTRMLISSCVACTLLGIVCLVVILDVAFHLLRGYPIPDGLVGIVGVATGSLTGWLVSPRPQHSSVTGR